MKLSDIAIRFLETCALKDPRAAFAEHAHPDFKHHNQYFRGDRDSLMEAMIEADAEQPNRALTVKQVFETGDRVALYSHVVKDTMQIAVVHMFRIQDGKIIEMWDVGMVLDPNSPNQYGAF